MPPGGVKNINLYVSRFYNPEIESNIEIRIIIYSWREQWAKKKDLKQKLQK